MSERAEAHASVEPWGRDEAIALVVGLSVSALAILAGYIGASGEARLTGQYPWLSVAILGIAGGGVVHARWLLAGLTALRLRQRQVVRSIAALSATATSASLTPTWSDAERVAALGASARHHRPGCAMVVGKVTERATAEEFAAAGRAECAICAPS